MATVMYTPREGTLLGPIALSGLQRRLDKGFLMRAASAGRDSKPRLLAQVTCPNCWHRFSPDQLLFVATHDSLIGDQIAGPNAYRRFLPSRFTITGDAIDAEGMTCQQVACPHCHLEVGRPLIEVFPFFTSIVGAPASGKSYFLAAMTWSLRHYAKKMGLVFSDADPTANLQLQQYEETLFLSADGDQPVALRKTETQGEQLYQSVYRSGQRQTFPRPFQFIVRSEAHRAGQPRQAVERALVLYDNAGEHFLPGQDATATPVTQHLAKSNALFFVFDPVQDPRFRPLCDASDPQIAHGTRQSETGGTSRQEIILHEMSARIRRYRGLRQDQRHDRPLIVILAKADLWLQDAIAEAPFTAGDPATLKLGMIDRVSERCRALLAERCPEIVQAAEHFATRVCFIPVSSLGTSPELVDRDGDRFYGVRPSLIRPKWAEVPMLWAMSVCVPGLLPAAHRSGR